MPATGVVIDAFKNILRHGKAHNDKSHQKVPDAGQTRDPAFRSAGWVDKNANQHHQQQQQQQQQQRVIAQNAPMPSPDYRREAELIVQKEKEEREEKNKMPVIKGLEKYKLIEKMGDGAFSNVYKAIDLTTGQKVAVKVVRKYELNASQDENNKHLNPQFKKRPRATERANILKEVTIMRQLSHPSIIRLLQFFESNQHYFLVLELMEGGELFHQIVKLTYFSENLARHVILQVAQGIRYLHEDCGVVHRDIKPENLLFERIPIIPSKQPVQRPYDEEKEDEGDFVPGRGGGGIGRVKIADFGLSKQIRDETTATPCGTVGYTAPEIVKDERYSKSVDMWALGCVLYTLLCGFPPFYDESINVLTEKVARGYYTFLSPWWDDISASAKDLITHLLCVDPVQRYTIDEFLAHPWCNAAPAPPPPPTPLTAPLLNRAIDSPLLQSLRGGREARSPGLATLKEAFDITYAVHRMEEEGARRRIHGAGNRGFLQGLNEDDEEEDEQDDRVVQQARTRQEQASSRKAAITDGRAGVRDQAADNHDGVRGFDLNMNEATLLGRRHRRGGVASGLGSPLKQTAPGGNGTLLEVPASPMQIGSPPHTPPAGHEH